MGRHDKQIYRDEGLLLIPKSETLRKTKAEPRDTLATGGNPLPSRPPFRTFSSDPLTLQPPDLKHPGHAAHSTN